MSVCFEWASFLTAQQRQAMQAHLRSCKRCAAEHQETQRLAALIEAHWGAVSDGTLALLEQASRRGRRIVPVPGRRIWTVAAVAAGLLVAAGVALLALQAVWRTKAISDAPATTAALGTTGQEAFAELLTPSGRRRIPLGETVVVEGQPQEVLLGGAHRLVMNSRTSAAFFAGRADPTPPGRMSAAAYQVRLDHGELYVQAAPGLPFTVRTPDALVTVTGTTFDVVAGIGRTELTVVEGSVRFDCVEAPGRGVTVRGGYCSRILGRSAPSAAAKFDAVAAVAWAQDALAANRARSVAPETDLVASVCGEWLQPSLPALDSLDYATWRDEHRDWFAKEFPWIFRIRDALQREHGIEADYLDLLMVSGDIWQFHYPRPPNLGIPVFDEAAAGRLAGHYKVDRESLLRAASSTAAGSPSQRPPASSAPGPARPAEPGAGYAGALRDWRQALAAATAKGDVQGDLLLFTLRASAYLANTRTAACLWIRAHPAQAEALVQDQRYLSQYLAPLGFVQPMTCAVWADRLGAHVACAGEACNAAREMLLTVQPGQFASGEGEAMAPGRGLLQAVSTLISETEPEGK
jgi:hypothetical protein